MLHQVWTPVLATAVFLLPQILPQPEQICLHLPLHLPVRIHLNQKIAELEQRISRLYQIWEDEKHFDTMVLFGPALAATAGDLDSTVPCINTIPTQSDAQWVLLRAKPKAKPS